MSLISSAALHKSITYLPFWLRDEKAQRKVHLSMGTDNEKIFQKNIIEFTTPNEKA